MCGGLIERRAYSECWPQGEGLLVRGLKERNGFNGGFAVAVSIIRNGS